MAELENLLARVAPMIDVRDARFLGEGWDNRLFLVNDDLVVRIARTDSGSRQLLVEARMLRAIAPYLSLPIPQPDFVHQPSPDVQRAVMGYRLLPGASLNPQDVNLDITNALTPDLARFLSDLHSIPVEMVRGCGIDVWSPGGWLQRHDDMVRNALGDLRRMLDEPARSRFLGWWNSYRQDPVAVAFKPCVIHGDLASEHVLVARDPWRVTGIVDFGDAMVADPALDLAGFPDVLARAVLGSMKDVTDQQAVWQRRDAYRTFVPLHAVTAGRERGDSELLNQGITGLKVRFSG